MTPLFHAVELAAEEQQISVYRLAKNARIDPSTLYLMRNRSPHSGILAKLQRVGVKITREIIDSLG